MLANGRALTVTKVAAAAAVPECLPRADRRPERLDNPGR